jgi:hypothetical protein
MMSYFILNAEMLRLYPEYLLGGESLGRTRANTFSFPMARVARTAQTELSIPPDTATTQPLRKRVDDTISRILRGIRSTASAKSKSSQG